MPTSPVTVTPFTVLQRLGVTVAQPAMAPQVLRGTITSLSEGRNLSQHLEFGEVTQTDLSRFIGDGDPTQHLLERLDQRADALKVLLAGNPQAAPSPSQGPQHETVESIAAPVSDSGAVAVRNPGLKMPVPEGGFGLALADFDKTLLNGNSHTGLIKHGWQTRADELQKLEDKWNRLWQTMKMTYRYQRHTLDPGSASEAVAAQLDQIPVLPVAREWADAAAREHIKRGVLRSVHEKARGIVRAEVEQLIHEGKMAEPLSDKDLEEEARTRIFIVSSQFAEVLKMLTDVGPEHENLLGMNPENVLGSSGTFTPEGYFVADTSFVYCFDKNKPLVAKRAFEGRGIAYNAKTTKVFTDDVWYDRFLLAMAENSANQVIVDPDSRDADYARHEKTAIIYDTPYLLMEGHWEEVVTKRGKRIRRFVVDSKKSFFPDSNSVATTSDAWQRAVYGMGEMLPMAAGEAIMHGALSGEIHPAALVIPVGAGMLYGPLKRGWKADLAVGAAIGGGMAYFHGGNSILAAVIGATSFVTLKFLQRKLQFERKAKELGPDGFKGVTKGVNFFWRVATSSGWATAMRVLHLG